MKKIILSSMLAVSLSVTAQDVIYKPDGTKIDAKVIEITPTEVKYKSFTNPDGPLYSISKTDLMMIIYQNGKNEVFTNTAKNKSTNSSSENKMDSLHDKFGRNFISYNLFGFFVGNISLAYEHFLPKGYLGIKVPITIGFSNDIRDFRGDYKNVFTSGVDLNFYPTGQGKIRYFTGPSFRVGLVETNYYDPYSYYVYPYSYTYGTEQSMFYAGLVNNGVLFQPLPNFNMSVTLGLGVQYVETRNIDNTQFYATFGYHLGYRF